MLFINLTHMSGKDIHVNMAMLQEFHDLDGGGACLVFIGASGEHRINVAESADMIIELINNAKREG